MLYVYNETDRRLDMKVLGNANKALSLTKVRDYMRDNRPVREQMRIVINPEVFGHNVEALDAALDKAINMEQPLNISGEQTSIIFSKKDMNPYITLTEKDTQAKDIILASILLKGRRVVKIENEKVFILEHMLIGGELGLIASLNDPTRVLKVYLQDMETKAITMYQFGYTDSKEPEVAVTIENLKKGAVEIEVKEHFRIQRFRPNKPTHVIFVYKKDAAKLREFVDPEFHYIVEVGKDTVDEEIHNIIEEGYRAVTLFVNFDAFTDTTKKIYGGIVKKLEKSFPVYFELFNDKKIYKIKY